jgi:serine/threonine-protein kinase
VVALLGGGTAGALLLVSNQVPEHPVPSVVDRPRADAEGTLRALRFNVVVREEFRDATTAGTVVDQIPKAGTAKDGKPVTLEEKKPVTIVVSKGPPPTAVPDLSDLTEAKAKAAIEKAGHVVGDISRPFNEDVDAGVVLDWTHKDESPPKGTRIDLTVSAGAQPRTVPELTGLTFEQATAKLAAIGLKIARTDAFNDDDDTKGKVVSSSPAGGASVARGSVVSVGVSKGQPQVPDLKGLTVEEAKAKLAAAELKLGSSFGPGGKIFLTTPPAGTKVKRNSAVDVFIL